jgi:hypothetical protein
VRGRAHFYVSASMRRAISSNSSGVIIEAASICRETAPVGRMDHETIERFLLQDARRSGLVTEIIHAFLEGQAIIRAREKC